MIVKIGKIPTWGKTIEKFQWDPTWYCIIEEIDEMRCQKNYKYDAHIRSDRDINKERNSWPFVGLFT